MDFLLIFNGFGMAFIGFPIVFIGFPMIFVQSSYGNPRVPNYGFPMDF
jgi:hypothetical protein